MRRPRAPRHTVVLVVAKAPVPGYAKTRLAATVGAGRAADIASAALLDTLGVVAQLRGAGVVALAGDLTRASRRHDLEQALSQHHLIEQRGDGLGQRLAAAHVDAAKLTNADAVVQIGMDTPQLTADFFGEALAALAAADAALGAAADGGWWCLGVRNAALAQCLRSVPMSRPDTAAKTYAALRRQGASVSWLPELRDVDTFSDAVEVAATIPHSRFASAVQISADAMAGGCR